MNAKKLFLSFILILGLFCSCGKQTKSNTETKSPEEEAIRKIEALLLTPEDSRSAEEKVLLEQIGSVIFGRSMIQNERIVITISKKEWTDLGLLEVYYSKWEKEIEDYNNYLDTINSVDRQLFIESYKEAQERYTGKDRKILYAE